MFILIGQIGVLQISDVAYRYAVLALCFGVLDPAHPLPGIAPRRSFQVVQPSAANSATCSGAVPRNPQRRPTGGEIYRIGRIPSFGRDSRDAERRSFFRPAGRQRLLAACAQHKAAQREVFRMSGLRIFFMSILARSFELSMTRPYRIAISFASLYRWTLAWH